MKRVEWEIHSPAAAGTQTVVSFFPVVTFQRKAMLTQSSKSSNDEFVSIILFHYTRVGCVSFPRFSFLCVCFFCDLASISHGDGELSSRARTLTQHYLGKWVYVLCGAALIVQTRQFK